MAEEKDAKKEAKDEEQMEEEDETEEEKTEEEADNNDEKEEADESEAKEEESPEAEGEDVEVPKKFEDLIAQIEEMPVLELNELVKVIEAKWGVSAQAVAAGPADAGAEAEEKSEYTVELTDFGDSKIGVIKAVKSALGLGLKEAKDLVEDAPTVLKEGVPTEDAETMKEAIEEAGGSVELK